MKNSTLFFSINLLFLIAYQQLSFGQSYDQFISLADSAYEVKDFRLSGEYYEKAFLIDDTKPMDLYNAACSWSRAGDVKKSAKYLSSRLNIDPDWGWGWIIEDSDLATLRKHPIFQKIEKKFHNHSESVLHFQDVVKLIVDSKDKQVWFRDKTIVTPTQLNNKEFYYSLGFSDSTFNMPNKVVVFENCNFIHEYKVGEKVTFFMNSWKLKTLQINNSGNGLKDVSDIEVKNCSIAHLSINNVGIPTEVSLSDLHSFKFSGSSTLSVTNSSLGMFTITGINLKSLNFENNVTNNYNNQNLYRIKNRNIMVSTITGTISNIEINNNSFIGIDSLKAYGSIAATCDNFLFRNNILNYPFTFSSTVVRNQFDAVDNQFEKVDFSRTVFPELNTYVPYDQLRNDKIVLFQTEKNGLFDLKTVISNSHDKGFEDKENFEKLIYQYQRLYNNYRLRGEIESANECYVAIKKLHIDRYKNIQESNPSLKNYFKLKIGQLLGFYVEHGTNPAKAIVISFYILIVFAVFYFFFPSEWDTTSKGKLISNFKDFTQKNDKGYVLPFFKMLRGFAISLINALTLSLNSFVTLGFGTIPTTGLARYVCIIQGFIGWFLLSIFTVALINQVLA